MSMKKSSTAGCVSVLTALTLAFDFANAAPRPECVYFDFPGGIDTAAFGINERGDVVGVYDDEDGNRHGVLRRNGHLTALDVPGATFSAPRGINNLGDVVGRYLDGNRTSHGFLMRGD